MRLNEVDETLSPGSGKVDLFLFGQGSQEEGRAGVGLDYEHRLNERLSAFANAEIAKTWGQEKQLAWKAMFGGRLRF